MLHPGPERGIFANRTLNLRSIRAIGYDMDYTLIDYNAEEWERTAFEHARRRLADRGLPVDDAVFDHRQVIRGLALDLELGNLVKATRFGYVIHATHGTRPMEFDELRRAYSGQFVDLAEDRYEFVNTLFSLSEASLFAQLVDQLEAGNVQEPMGFDDLYAVVRQSVDEVHREGDLKAEILSDPDRFVRKDAEVVLALRDQRRAGKRLVLITDSEWEYADRVMSYAFDEFLDSGNWRSLFDAIVVSARKPGFFTERNPLYIVEDEERALLRPHHGAIESGSVFFGGNAAVLEESLGISGAEILHVGDHLLSDVRATKAMLRWRTAIVLRELEDEVRAQHDFLPLEEQLREKMRRKVEMESEISQLRLVRQRREQGYGPPEDTESIDPAAGIERLLGAVAELDQEIAPLAKAATTLGNEWWGPLMRAGNDKSLFARQMERYADIYTSRVANFLFATPYAYIRAARSSLPHDQVEWIDAE
mgnify:CR=1 FL=1